jgi:hypothetical protein
MTLATSPGQRQCNTLVITSQRDPAITWQKIFGTPEEGDTPLAPPAAVRQVRYVRRLTVPGGPSYPLRRSFGVTLFRDDRGAQATIPELASVVSLQGQGKTDDDALAVLADLFDRLVEDHWRVPPHAQTDEDRSISRVLAHMVNWDEYEAENPVEEALWGRVQRILDDSSRQVFWFLGPGGVKDTTEVLPAGPVCRALWELEEGDWFYGAGKLLGNRLVWTVAPVRAPDPHDPEAVREAWDLIPSKVMSDAAAWPLRHSE